MDDLLSGDRIDQARADLPYLREVTYLDNAAVSPVPRSVQLAADRYNAFAASGVDVLVVGGHKWMMAPRGIGFMSLSRRALARITPRIVGWLSVQEPFAFGRVLDLLPDARRFESGTPNGSGMFGLAERLRQIDALNPRSIERRVLDLNRHLASRCESAGLELLFHVEDSGHSGIFLVRKPGVPAQVLLAALNAERIHASLRSEAIRLSPHYYNTVDELDRAVAVMAAARPTA